jgi:hypothetical protein
MKNALRLLAIAALATVFALPAYAQDPAATPAATPTGPCAEADAKAAIYKKFTDNFKGTPDQQKLAYEAGREYLSKYGSCEATGDKQIATYVQNWVTKYEKAVVEFNCTKAVHETPAQAFQACQQILAANPDNLKVYLQLVTAGLKNAQAKNTSTNAEAANAARKALQLLDQRAELLECEQVLLQERVVGRGELHRAQPVQSSLTELVTEDRPLDATLPGHDRVHAIADHRAQPHQE